MKEAGEKTGAISRRKLFIWLGVFAAGMGSWKRFAKGLMEKGREAKISLHPAQFYAKLFNKPSGG